MYKEEKALVIETRKEATNEIKELNEYVRLREIEHIETLNNLSTIMSAIDEKMDKLNTML
jgi:two-component sensor histidine kinase